MFSKKLKLIKSFNENTGKIKLKKFKKGESKNLKKLETKRFMTQGKGFMPQSNIEKIEK